MGNPKELVLTTLLYRKSDAIGSTKMVLLVWFERLTDRLEPGSEHVSGLRPRSIERLCSRHHGRKLTPQLGPANSPTARTIDQPSYLIIDLDRP
jgi:hypothetical protein